LTYAKVNESAFTQQEKNDWRKPSWLILWSSAADPRDVCWRIA
jgi:hypothetical protein